MPFTTGTARTPSELLKAINTHLTANGWTRLRGEVDMDCASPKAARYWRMLVWDVSTSTTDFVGLQLLNMRTTSGGANVATNGANFSAHAVGTGTASLMAAGGLLRSPDIDDRPWWVMYDFGTPTTIREFYVRGDSIVANCPKNFCFQWSNDAITWTTMREYSGITWTASEYKTFTIADGYVHTRHAASNAPRRSGNTEEFTIDADMSTNARRDFSEDYWAWQGPGYDAARRVYLHARGYCNEAGSTHGIMWDYSIGYDANVKPWNGQLGSSLLSRTHLMDSGTVTYWIYSNSKRLILVTRSGAQDYTSSYIGFLSAFATPDDYPFPLYVGATMPDYSSYVSGDTNARLSSCADPGLNAAAVRLWDGTVVSVGNRPDSSTQNQYLQTPNAAWVWPYHLGSNVRAIWPYDQGSDWYDYVGAHLFDYVRATEQSQLPIFPCVVTHDPYGNIGVLDGVFAIPSGGLLTPTQTITVDGNTYRIFPNRTRREPVAWMAIRED